MSPAEMESDKMVEVEAAADPEERTASGGGGDPKACDDCNTTKTPLWRGGPNGPKSLCNACGIRYRKRRRVAMGLDPEAKRKPKRDDAALSKAAAATPEASTTKEEEEEEEDKAGDDTKAGEEKASSKKAKTTTKTHHTVELHMVGFAKDAVLKQRRRMRMRMRRRKPSCLGEEERAAILLMSLSSGVIYA